VVLYGGALELGDRWRDLRDQFLNRDRIVFRQFCQQGIVDQPFPERYDPD